MTQARTSHLAGKIIALHQAHEAALPASIIADMKSFRNHCASLTASEKTHYDGLDEWQKPVMDFVRMHLNQCGFVNGRPDINQTLPAVQVWLAIYSLVNRICWSPKLKTEVANHHASAQSRNQAIIAEMEDIFMALGK